eukprot:4276297-Pleurochrysis_carterae.AAC.1
MFVRIDRKSVFTRDVRARMLVAIERASAPNRCAAATALTSRAVYSAATESECGACGMLSFPTPTSSAFSSSRARSRRTTR